MNYADIRGQLEAILSNNPNNETVKAALQCLEQLERELSSPSSSASTLTGLALISNLEQLLGQGLWGKTANQKQLLEALSQSFRSDPLDGLDPSYIVVSSPSQQQMPAAQASTLPPELLGQINEAYLLHSLATNPTKTLPPGKSLLSIFSSQLRHESGPGSQKLQSLKDQVSEVATRAFWDEALDSLSSPTPSVQLSRLRLLYADLRVMVTSLIHPFHPIMHTLSDPLSPTSSPLRSASQHLQALLSVLRERCAPARDVKLDTLSAHLKTASLQDLPKALIDTIRGILEIAEEMKDDLADFVIGTWTEQDARQWVRKKAIELERRVVLQMFSADIVRELYEEWLCPTDENIHKPIVPRLLKALGSSEPVAPFPPTDNLLPPPFIFTAFDLLKAQNLLQGLVIAASLHSLVRTRNKETATWLSRVWALLQTEVDRHVSEPAETKLLNLEDEVVHAARLTGDPDAELQLREAVRRTLRTQDPVFKLLQSRLLIAIEERLTEVLDISTSQIPLHMRTGRLGGKYLENEKEEPLKERELLVKGFEDVVLKDNIRCLVISVREILAWVEETWSTFLRR